MADSVDLIDPQVVARLQRLPLRARVAMEGTMSGHHKSPHRGSSVEFAEYRKYVPGDDLRRLDWRVLARTDRYYMKEFEAETNLRCYLALDCSGSMGFGDDGGKWAYARRLAATLGYLAVNQGDAAGLLCFNDEVAKEIPARRNPAHLRNIFEALQEVKPKGTTDLASSLHDLAEKVRQRALVVVFSDFFTPIAPLLECLQHLRFRKHDLAVFQLLDRAELDFKFERPIRFTDLEGPFSLVTEPATIRDRYLESFHAHNEQLRHGCAEFKADYRQVVTDQDFEEVLAGFLIERARK